jgi:hypothetical protein
VSAETLHDATDAIVNTANHGSISAALFIGDIREA